MRKRPKARVTISASARQALLSDLQQRRHIEACGLLTGHIDDPGNWHVQQVYPLRNIFDSPVYFEFAPEDLLAVELAHPGEIIGAYHSHPTGLHAASGTDRENMQRVNAEQHIPWVWLIISGPFHTIEGLSKDAMIAYHHYEQNGLQQIAIEFEGERDAETIFRGRAE